MALPTLYQVAKSIGSLLGSSYTLTGVTAAGGIGTITYAVSGSLPGSAVFTLNEGAQFAGVPGPEMAAGLPFLLMAASYGGYRYYRSRHAAR